MRFALPPQLWAFVSIALLSSACTATSAVNTHSLTPFQWAVSTDAMLVLVPVGDNTLYAAVREGAVLESLPPKVEVSIDALNEDRYVQLDQLVAPQEISNRTWQLQVRTKGQWVSQRDYQFDGEMFRLSNPPERVPFTSVRFVRR